MVLNCNYEKLVADIQDIANVVEDPLSADDDKSIIFMLTKGDTSNKAKLIGISPVITLKRDLNENDYQLTLNDEDVNTNGMMLFTINSKELLGFLNTYKSLKRTKVDELIFEQVRNKIKCTVIESTNYSQEELDEIKQEHAWTPDEPDVREEKFYSSWMFNMGRVKPSRLPNVMIEAPEGVVLEHQSDVLEFDKIAKSMIPIVENANTTYGFMNFSEEHIVVFNASFTAIMSNIIYGDTFKGIKLNYRTLPFISKIIVGEQDVQYAKLERHIYFKTEKSEAFIVYDSKLIPYEAQLRLMSNKERSFSVNRDFLQDIVRRFSLSNDSIEFTVDTENFMVKMSNSTFTQELPITSSNNFDDIGLIHFKVMPALLSKAIICDSSLFSKLDFKQLKNDDLIIYYNADTKAIIFGDVTKIWYSVLSVQVY